MIKKYIIRTIAALVLGFVIVISASPHAQAYSPNSLLVFTGFQPYGGTITPAVGVGGVIDVVPVPGRIPITASPYNGNHLDTDNNGSPNTNSTLWGTDGNYYGYSFQTKNYLIWCGKQGGLNDGELQADVSLAFANGGYANDTQLIVGGVVKTGRWVGEWWRQGEDGETWVGFSTYFNGRTARIATSNPGLMVVKFTFIEDAPPPPPPPPTYIGQIQTQKRMNAVGNPLVTEQDLLNAKTQIYQANGAVFRCGNFSTCSNTGLNIWATGVVMWVNPSVVTSNDNSAGYLSKIDVPFGYRVNRVQLSRSANVAANAPNLSCTGSNNTGTCSTITKVWNQDTTFVDWFLEKIPPTLTVSCISDNPTTGGKITVTASSNIPGDTNSVTIKKGIDINPPTEIENISGSYTFDIASNYRDGGTHTYYATYGGLSKSVAFGPGQTCKIDKWFYPWLQTSQGDVVADGEIEGQTTSTGTGTLGARIDSTTAKEAEFLVISAVGGDGPFCSTYKYILTNTSSQGTNCGNGAGYNFNSTGIDNDTVDRVIGGVKQAFADNGNNANSAPSACSANGIATATVTTMPASISTTCPGGVIYKLSSGTLGLTTLLKGRATIFVDGNLTITDDLYANSAQVDPKLAPALAIVVTGNINIAYNPSFDGISYIRAQLYSAEKINTCTTNTGTPATTNECSLPLDVKGSLSAKKGFEFKRTYVEPSNLAVYRDPAESIKMTGMHLAFPPPGLDSRYFYNNFSSYKLDSAEYNPRF